jgi:hypothetical protein
MASMVSGVALIGMRLGSLHESGTLLGSFRARRWAVLGNLFPDLGQLRVLDLGGDPRAWLMAPAPPKELVILNVTEYPVPHEVSATLVVGDACAPPAEISGGHFDLVYSNSVIEHVGGHSRRQQLSEVVRSLGSRYFVQTPYRYVPIEPHWRLPLFQFLPRPAQVVVSSRWGRGDHPTRRKPMSEVLEDVQSVELLSATELSSYFPDGFLLRERFCGLTKSLIAVRN